MRHFLSIVLTIASARIAHADVPRCASVDSDLSYHATDLAEHSGDTGWFPSGYSAQLRITGRITGETTVAMGLAPQACWTDGMTVQTPGRAQAGLLDAEYGAEVHLFGQIHTSVVGYQIDWSGEIPVPVIPTDLMLATTTAFDPVALPGSPTVSAHDTTSTIVLLSTNLLADIIDITGISGGLDLDVQGAMTTSYTTSAITLGDAQITTATGAAAIAAPAAGFGGTLALPIAATGTVHYAPALTFSVAFDVKILGIRVVNWQLASVTLPLSTIDRTIALAGADVTIPLPHFATIPATLGFADGATQPLRLRNAGAAPLVIAVTSAPAGVTANGLTIAPGADGVITVTAADATHVSGALVLATNDPNAPSLSVALDAMQSGQTNTGGDANPEAGGCHTGRGNGSLVLALALVALRRRRPARTGQ
jgi:hypothetical protein